MKSGDRIEHLVAYHGKPCWMPGTIHARRYDDGTVRCRLTMDYGATIVNVIPDKQTIRPLEEHHERKN